MSPITIRAWNFRRLDRFEWTPVGVCLLSGANGAGKTSTLDMLRFLGAVFMRGMDTALVAAEGDYFRTRGAGADALVEFEISVQDIRWRLRLPMSDAGLKGHYGEELWQGDTLVLRAAPYGDAWFIGDGPPLAFDDPRCCARRLWDRGDALWMEPLYRALNDLRVYEAPWLNHVRDGSARGTAVTFLHGTGQNLWAVLSAWHAAPRKHNEQLDWVMRHARQAFPDLIETIEFDRGEVYVYPPGVSDPAGGLPARRQAAGLLTGLLHLTAIAGARPGSLIAIDEMENQLHPHAIRSILQSMRERASQQDLTVILTTHSPVVMNEFKGQEDRFYLLERSGDHLIPVALDRARDTAWLSHFSLGDLYEREKFGAPSPSSSIAAGNKP